MNIRHRIKEVKCELISACQHDCTDCAHGEQRRQFPEFQLTLEQLRRFLDVTEESGYFIESFSIHGLGEPLLWPHLKEGLRMIKESPCIGRSYITTNAMAIHKLDEEILGYLDYVLISDYSEGKNEKVAAFKTQYPNKVNAMPKGQFRRLPEEGETAPIPCTCLCFGPMFFGDHIFLFCGPPVFGAAKMSGINVFDFPELYTSVDVGWYDKYLELQIHSWPEGAKMPVTDLELCKYCWSNNNYKLSYHSHSNKGGSWRGEGKEIQNFSKRAVEYYLNEGYSCSESIVKASLDVGFTDDECLLNVATSFSGGMSSGCVCGAISGSQMVLGSKHGRTKTNLAREKAKAFMEEFCKSHKCTCCVALTRGFERHSPERKEHCSKIVEECAEILEKLI